MNKLIAAIKRAPKRASGLALMIAAAIIVPAALQAWGPDRPTFTIEKPAPYVTFNSITNNPTQGDERNFVQIKEAGAPNSSYAENVALQPGKEYEVFTFYHNNAATNLNSAENDYKGIARNTAMRVQMPATVAAGEKARFTSIISASNAQPQQVWDEAYGTASSAVALRYVPGSATITSNGAVNGAKLPDSLFKGGASLGYDKLDGNLPGCNQYAGYVTFRFKVDQPNFEVKKTVTKAGENAYGKSVTTTPNGLVEYKIEYKNTGTTQQSNVVIKDVLPKGVSYVAGSTKLASSASNGQYAAVGDGVTTAAGINIGSYAPGGNAFVKFTAKVTDNASLEKCGVNTLVNKATADTRDGVKDDTANVVVTKECPPEPPKPIYTCDALAVQKLTNTSFKFETSYTATNANMKTITYVVRDESGKELYRGPNATYTQTTPGKYTVQAYVTFTVDGSDKTVTAEGCKKAFEVTPPTPGKIEVCDLTTNTLITINENQFDQNKHSKNLADCKTPPVVPPVTPPVTPVTPGTPDVLPQTGATENVLGIIGLSSLVATAGYYIASRRALNR